MKQIKIALLFISMIIFMVSCQSTTPAPAADPAAIMDAYTVAINAHDLEAALALVAEDAVYDRPSGQFTGKAEVKTFIEGLFAQNVKVELVGKRRVEGEKVYWTSHVTLTDPKNPNGPPIELTNLSESTIRNGKIVFHKATRAP